MSGFSQRANLWRSYADNTRGFLYWSANHYSDYRHPVQSDDFWFPTLPKGDGVLVYDGSMFPGYACDDLVASVRLERLRDSLEDYEYLEIEQTRHGRNRALAALAGVYTAPSQFTDSVSALESLRKPSRTIRCQRRHSIYAWRQKLHQTGSGMPFASIWTAPLAGLYLPD